MLMLKMHTFLNRKIEQLEDMKKRYFFFSIREKSKEMIPMINNKRNYMEQVK